MSFGTILSAAVSGLTVELIHVETDVSNGLPGMHMVGYLSSEVKEATQRVRTAIKNSGIELPVKKTVINLAPAAVRKKGSAFDLPIAISILISTGYINPASIKDTIFIGELGLDGKIIEVPGILPVTLKAHEEGIKKCVVPYENAKEGALAGSVSVIGVKNLTEVIAWLSGKITLRAEKNDIKKAEKLYIMDYSDIKGQKVVKRAAEIAAAGGHNLLLTGPPGSGKSMIAQRVPGIFPPMTIEESLEVTKIYSILGILDKKYPLMTERPFRNVHHTATRSALTGGGVYPQPGEISLAHKGVLFLDELPEFRREVIEVLRQPMEEHLIRLSRRHGKYIFPADFTLIAAMNNCPCGYYPDLDKCTCTAAQIHSGRISKPFLDRIDLCVEAPKVEYEALAGHNMEETTSEIRKRVCKARDIQNERYQGSGISCNARIPTGELEQYCYLETEERKVMEQAFRVLDLTARSYHKILKVARTIADLDGEERILVRHITEAAGYRTIDKTVKEMGR